MTPTEIREALFQLRDEEYRVFQARLIPTVEPDTMIGVRTQGGGSGRFSG